MKTERVHSCGNEDSGVSGGGALHSLFMEVFTLHDRLSAVMDAVHEAAGMGSSQLRVAHAALNMPNATVPRIAERLNVSRQFVQKVCDHLAWEGVLAYGENPQHKRSPIVTVTESGRKTLEEVAQNEAAIISRFLTCLPKGDILGTTKLLRSIREQIEEVRWD